MKKRRKFQIKNYKKVLKIVSNILFILIIVLFLISLYIKVFFSYVTFEQILYSLINFKGTNMSIIFKGLAVVIIVLIILYILKKIISFIINKINYKVIVYINICNKKIKINFKLVFKILLSFLMVYLIFRMLSIDDYIKMLNSSTNLYEEYYVDPKLVDLEFPNNKRNLIYIYLESMEMTNASKKNGGALEKSYIPNLEEIALSNINFSNTNKLGGGFSVYGTNYTSSSIVAQTAGVPLRVSIGWRNYKNYGKSLPGVYNLGDILKDNGYSNYFIMGSDADYGGRKDYLKHGDYEIFDYYWAINGGLIDKDYKVWWGYEDLKLFEFAKNKLLEISKLNEPFNFTMLTVDTHFMDGYQDDTCEQLFEKKYANSIYCSDNKVYEFINWVKNQSFYDNTTIILVGDHLSPQRIFYNNVYMYDRVIYDAIINSPVEPKQEKERLFTPLDMFPTTLASLGVKINGNKLGLGVNLYSEEKTLIEILGKDELENELKAKSFYYDNNLLKDHYYKMQKDLKNEDEVSDETN